VGEGIRQYRANLLLDEDGRPLGELASPRYEEVTTEVVACPYPDRRRGLPMNQSALRQIAPLWPAIVASVRVLVGDTPTMHQAWRVAMVGIAAPLVVDEPVPRLLSAFYKTSLGLSQVTTRMLLADDEVADAPFADLGDGEALFASLDQHGWLIGQVQVCAGTRAMFVQLGDALSGRPDPARPPTLAPELAALDCDALAELAGAAVHAQVRDLGALQDARRRGEALELPSVLPPWLRAAAGIPGLTRDHAARLFPAARRG
jgi:hypothetical protein